MRKFTDDTRDSFSGTPSVPYEWAPKRSLADIRQARVDTQLQQVVTETITTDTTVTDTAVDPNAALQLLSVSATESPTKVQGRTMSEVSVSFTQDPSDTNAAGARIWLTGYKGSANPVLVAEGTTSPVTFLCESTGETVFVTAQAAGANGTPSDFDSSLITSVTLDGVVSAPPAPSISQSLVAIPLGLQFSFNQVNVGSTQDVIDSYRVYRNTTNNSSTATLHSIFKHDPTASGAIVVQDGVGGGNTYYYWVSAVNTAGLESPATAAQSGAVASGTASASTDLKYSSGVTVESLKPAQAGADTTRDKVGVGQNALPNPSFEFASTDPLDTTGITGWADTSSVFQANQNTTWSAGILSGSASLQLLAPTTGYVIGAGVTIYGAVYNRNLITCIPGQKWKVGGWLINAQNNPTGLPSGIAIGTHVRARVLYSDNSYDDFLTSQITTCAGVFVELSTTFTVPTPTGKTVLGIQVIPFSGLTNTTGSPITLPVGYTVLDTRVDNVYLIRQASLVDEISDKSAQYISYSGGASVDSLKPAEAGAEVTTGKPLDILSDGVTYARPLASRLNSGRPVIDFSEGIHANKNLDNIPDGTRAAWDSTTQKGAAVDSSGNLLLKNKASAVGLTSNPTTTATSYAVIPEMTKNVTTRGNTVMVTFAVGVTTGGHFVYLAIFRDGVQISAEFGGNTGLTTVVGTCLDTPSAGSHTYDIRWRIAFAPGGTSISADGTNRIIQVVELG